MVALWKAIGSVYGRDVPTDVLLKGIVTLKVSGTFPLFLTV